MAATLPPRDFDRLFASKNRFFERKREVDVEVGAALGPPATRCSSISKKRLEDLVETETAEI
jgi:hypothetical protein